MIWFFAVLALLFTIDAFRVRGRIASIPALAESSEPVSPEHRFITAPGVTLDEAARRAASAHARANNLRVLDLIPADLPAMRAWGLFQILDPVAYRKDRLGKGRTAGHAILVDEGVLDRARLAGTVPLDAVTFARLAGRLKHYACTETDTAIAPALHATPEDRRLRYPVLREALGDGGADVVLLGVPVILIVLACGAVYGGIGGLAALATFALQPLLAFTGGSMRPRGLVWMTLFRAPLELWGALSLAIGRGPAMDPATLADRRSKYALQIEGGTDRFFEPRITTCPICGGADLAERLRTVDLLQHKPGRFALDRCTACDHIFQNPRLTIEGLDFYYGDFYDGLGEADLEAIFGAQAISYQARARVVIGANAAPSRWLDVGGGHGHFCCAAQELLPKTRFDALDLSESIEEAHRRGWVEQSYRGLFPDVAPRLTGAYDVVSMSHYLEHTREPKAELDAARTALATGGLLMIEVPDPECVLGKVLGRLWLPWFQPQHQHLLSVGNLTRLLEERGFEMVVTHRGEAHQEVDFFAAAYLFLAWLVPKPDEPWRAATGQSRRALRTLVFLLGSPALLMGRVMDAICAPMFRRSSASNTYRVLARKVGAAAGS